MNSSRFVVLAEESNMTNTTDPPTEPPTEPVSIPVIVMLIIFSVVGVVGNAIAFYIFFGRRSTSTSVIFILALAGTDFFTCLVTIPYTIVFEQIRYHLTYDLACKTYMFLITSTVPFSAYIMVGIALDRYFCICHPFLFVFTLNRAKAVIFCMGIPALFFGIITSLSYGTYLESWDIQEIKGNTTVTITSEKLPIQVWMSEDEVQHILATHNISNISISRQITHYGICHNNTFIFSQDFLEVYKKIHALNFLVAYVAVAVLYVLIYKSIFTRRANKARRRKENNIHVSASSKFKDIPQEETQMTIINGAESTSPKSGNQQNATKEAKCARKVTSSARNDSSAFSKADPQRESCNAMSASEEKEEEKVSLLDENNEIWSNETAGNSSNVSTCNTASTTCDLIPGTTGDEEDIGCGVYIGPQNEQGCGGIYIGPQKGQVCGVYIGPQAYVKLLPPSQITKSCDEKTKMATGAEGEQTTINHSANNVSEKLSECLTSDHDTTPAMSYPVGSTPEERLLLLQSAQSHATPPTSLSLRSNVSKLMSAEKGGNTSATKLQKPAPAKLGQPDTQTNSIKKKRPSTVRDRTLMANMKTAFMLFIVTLVFIIAFLPALLMANGLIQLNLFVFYGYFIYNVANPFIYAFMNQTFREDLKKIVGVCGPSTR